MKTIKIVTAIWVGAFLLSIPSKGRANEDVVAAAEPAAAAAPAAPAAPALQPPAPVKAKEAKDKRPVDYSCQSYSSRLDSAADCANNIGTLISEREEALANSDTRGAENLNRILNKAERSIKTAISRSFSKVQDSEELEEVSDEAENIASTVESDDSEFADDLRKLVKDLTGLAKSRIAARKEESRIRREYSARFDIEMRNYLRALESGSDFDVANAEKRLNTLQTRVNSEIEMLSDLDPSRKIAMMSEIYPEISGDLESFQTRFTDIEAALRNDMSGFIEKAARLKTASGRTTSTPSDGSRQTLPYNESRQARALFPMVNTLPIAGSPADLYGNSALNLNQSNPTFDSNSFLNSGSGRALRSGSGI